MPSPRVYITVSRSGQIFSPCSQRSSAVLAITVTSRPPIRGAAMQQALEETGPADAAGEDGERARGHGATLPHGAQVVQTGRAEARTYQNLS